MPSVLHEVIADLFRHRPQLAAELLTLASDTPLPDFDHARLDSGDFPDIDPTEYRADAVVVLAMGTTPVLGVIVEVQLRPDSDKYWSWPVYVTTLRSRLRCPTVLLVLCPSEHTASRCRAPISTPCFTLEPVALGPADVPIVTDPATAAANPELATLSAIAHRRHRDIEAILTTLVRNVVDTPNRDMYIDLVTAVMPKTARRFLEGLMAAIGIYPTGPYRYKSEFAQRYFYQGEAQGELQGEARALLLVLEARGIEVSEEAAARIHDCTDLEQLNAWVKRAVTVTTADELFAR